MGRPKISARVTVEYVARYFEFEAEWTQLVNKHSGKPVPFEVFFLWTQGKVKKAPDSSGQRCFRHIPHPPHLGKLAGYLLTADLVADKVQMPTMAELARIIHHNAMGSFCALQSAGLMPEHASEQEVLEALGTVHACLMDVLPRSSRDYVGYDLILLEHLLCKYQRTLSKR
ncbi:hypothetical protein C8Q76DRAFT_694604 [Earliella scabrosa]|nr:hypothetical protein C8Q76DRAFT_694604 [Earliella scabrosa]